MRINQRNGGFRCRSTHPTLYARFFKCVLIREMVGFAVALPTLRSLELR